MPFIMVQVQHKHSGCGSHWVSVWQHMPLVVMLKAAPVITTLSMLHTTQPARQVTVPAVRRSKAAHDSQHPVTQSKPVLVKHPYQHPTALTVQLFAAPMRCDLCTLCTFANPTLHSCTAVQVDAIVYLVDAADRERFSESQRELNGLLSDDGLATVPFLVLGNKIDLPYAVSEDELRHYLGLSQYTTGKGKVNLDQNIRPIEVFMCSVVSASNGGREWALLYIQNAPSVKTE